MAWRLVQFVGLVGLGLRAILKQSGSYQQASYALLDTPDVVQQHYGSFLPQDKSPLAAKILNQVWEAA